MGPPGFDPAATGAVNTGAPKRLVVCCDGVWVGSGRTGGALGGHAPTNVAKFWRAVSAADSTGNSQLTYYLLGIGTVRSPISLSRSLSQDVKQAYGFLIDNYTPGDSIYLLGFSRGAYVARSLAGLIGMLGVLRRHHAERVPDAYDVYRSSLTPRSKEVIDFRRRYAYADDVTIAFLGVWETVGPLGIPRLSRRHARAGRRMGFHDRVLGSTVRVGYQALALDEHRRALEPTLWEQQGSRLGQEVRQVWFTGAH